MSIWVSEDSRAYSDSFASETLRCEVANPVKYESNHGVRDKIFKFYRCEAKSVENGHRVEVVEAICQMESGTRTPSWLGTATHGCHPGCGLPVESRIRLRLDRRTRVTVSPRKKIHSKPLREQPELHRIYSPLHPVQPGARLCTLLSSPKALRCGSLQAHSYHVRTPSSTT